jgi:hypothetical protein
MSLPWPGVLDPGLPKDEVVVRNHRLAVLETLDSERWREWLVEWTLMLAGLAVQATRGLDAMPVGP